MVQVTKQGSPAGLVSGSLSLKLAGVALPFTSLIHSSKSTGSHMKSVTQSSKLSVPRMDRTAAHLFSQSEQTVSPKKLPISP